MPPRLPMDALYAYTPLYGDLTSHDAFLIAAMQSDLNTWYPFLTMNHGLDDAEPDTPLSAWRVGDESGDALGMLATETPTSCSLYAAWCGGSPGSWLDDNAYGAELPCSFEDDPEAPCVDVATWSLSDEELSSFFDLDRAAGCPSPGQDVQVSVSSPDGLEDDEVVFLGSRSLSPMAIMTDKVEDYGCKLDTAWLCESDSYDESVICILEKTDGPLSSWK